MTFDEAASVFVLVAAALLLGWRYRPRVFFGRLGATIRQIAGLFIMSRDRGNTAGAELGGEPVHVPVQTNQFSSDTALGGTAGDLPDTDAAEGGTAWQPKLPRYPTEEELVIYLATVRDRQGKYLRSANKIAEFSELHRNEVLKLVRQVRDGVPPYPAPLTPEQEETRRALALDQ